MRSSALQLATAVIFLNAGRALADDIHLDCDLVFTKNNNLSTAQIDIDGTSVTFKHEPSLSLYITNGRDGLPGQYFNIKGNIISFGFGTDAEQTWRWVINRETGRYTESYKGELWYSGKCIENLD
jgi:hypothetical protein